MRATSLNFGDGALLTGRPWLVRLVYGLRKPRSPRFGMDFAGEVVALGPGVTGFAPGDRVFGEAAGACAQYALASVDKVARVPEGVDLLDAASTPVAGVTALQALDMAEVGPGDKVLINGGSGGVGSFAVQIACARGAEVTAVCSGRNHALVTALGAAHVVDYTRSDFTQTGTRYDAVIDLAGSKSLAACRRLLTANGTYVASTNVLRVLLKSAVVGLFDRRVKVLSAPVKPAELETLGALMASGAMKPSISKAWQLDEIADAMAHQLTRRTQGKCVVRIP